MGRPWGSAVDDWREQRKVEEPKIVSKASRYAEEYNCWSNKRPAEPPKWEHEEDGWTKQGYPFQNPVLTFEVLTDGNLSSFARGIMGHGERIRLSAAEALALGKWLVETFGEETGK